ncbi:hypothetical protein Tco_1561022 [Tanacetum coccineum]
MSTKDSIAIQTYKLSEEEFNEFLALYSIPSSYHVILPKSNQTVLDAPPGYVGLYTHSFYLANLRLPLTKFICEVLEYFQVHISRLNLFGCAKLTTFVVMCKAYGCDPTVELFRGFFNLCRAGKWLTFAKRPEKHIPHLFSKVITRIEGWKERFFYVQNSIVPAKYPQLLLEQNKYDSKSYKDKLPLILSKTPCSNALVVILRAFVFFLIPSFFWLASNLREMAFRNFVYAEDEEDLSFIPKEPSPAFGTGSPSVSVNIEPLMTDEEPVLQSAEAMTDSRGSPNRELFVVHPGSVVARMKNRKCKTMGGLSKPPVKRKLAPGSSTARAKTFASKEDVSFLTISDEDEDAAACHLKILAITPPAWKNHLDNYMDLELLDLHDRCYARQAYVNNAMNRRSRELLGVIEKLRGKCDVIKERERAQEEESEGLRAKCEAAMSDFKKNPTVVVSLEAKKARLEAVEVSLQKEVDDVRRDRMEVVSKVVPYAAMELIHSDDLGSLVGKLVTSSIVYGRCKAFEQVAVMKEPFNLTKLSEFVADPSAPVEVLLSKKPPSIQKPAPSKTQALVASSQKATPSFVPASNTMSLPADISVVKPSSFQVE